VIKEEYRLSVFESGVIKSILSLRGRQRQEGGEMYIMMKEKYRAFWLRKLKDRGCLDGLDVHGTKVLELFIKTGGMGLD
jgi:hypothetical protein